MASTAIGSVGAMSAPNSRQWSGVRPRSDQREQPAQPADDHGRQQRAEHGEDRDAGLVLAQVARTA
jgi:hypothetical protein